MGIVFFPILQMKKKTMLNDLLSQLFCRTSIHIKVFGKNLCIYQIKELNECLWKLRVEHKAEGNVLRVQSGTGTLRKTTNSK